MKLNFEDLEMKKWNITTSRAQRVDEKNGVICLVIMFTPTVIVIKLSKMVNFFIFFANVNKKLVIIWANF